MSQPNTIIPASSLICTNDIDYLANYMEDTEERIAKDKDEEYMKPLKPTELFFSKAVELASMIEKLWKAQSTRCKIVAMEADPSKFTRILLSTSTKLVWLRHDLAVPSEFNDWQEGDVLDTHLCPQFTEWLDGNTLDVDLSPRISAWLKQT